MKLYALGLLAQKLDPELVTTPNVVTGHTDFTLVAREGESPSLTMILRVDSSATIAGSEDEARAAGLAIIRERCPEADGWINHSVSPCELSRSFLLDVVALTTPAADADEVGREVNSLLM
jgi:hypothetical protein